MFRIPVKTASKNQERRMDGEDVSGCGGDAENAL